MQFLLAADFFLNHTLQINVFYVALQKKQNRDTPRTIISSCPVDQLHEYADLEYEVFKISHQYHL